METKPKLKRTFQLLNLVGRNIDLVASLESYAGQEPRFNLACKNGSIYDIPLSALPTDIQNDLREFLFVNGRDKNGLRIHAIENTVYQLENARFALAQQELGAPSTTEELIQLYADVEDKINAKGKDNPINSQLYLVKVAASKVLEAKQRYLDGKAADIYGHLEGAYLLAYMKFDALKKVSESPLPNKVEGPRPDRRERIAKYEKVYPLEKLNKIAFGSGDEMLNTLRDVFWKRLLTKAVATYVNDHCMPIWKSAFDEAKLLLTLPDFRVEGRPAPEKDPKTFEGFLATNGLSFTTTHIGKSSVSPFRGSNEWKCEFSDADGKTFTVPFFMGSADTPTAETVLETLQSDAASIFGRDRDDWIEELGYADSIQNVRLGEKAFETIERHTAEMKELLGSEAYAAFMTDVGDNPPLSPSDFEQEVLAPAL